MKTEARVKIILGEKGDRTFSAVISHWYRPSDYWNPEESEYDIVSEIWDEDNDCDADALIDRYEALTGVDVMEAFIDEFKWSY